jgi:predicted MPP superfamily phosphohydrolase
MFWVVISYIIFGGVIWWRWADRRVRSFRGARAWRIAVTILGWTPPVYAFIFVLLPFIGRRSHLLPMPVMAALYIWMLMVLPATVILIGIGKLIKRIPRRPKDVEEKPAEPDLARRDFLNAAAISVPPLIATGIGIYAFSRLRDLRIRSIEVPIPNLPPPLDGLTFAQVSDIHIGKFTRPGMLDQIVEMTNRLRADMVIFTGDLIDLSLDDFDAGVETLRRFDPGLGMVMIEGNHDLIQDPFEFERRAKAANLPILLDETVTMSIRGVPVQFLGIRWGQPSDGPRRKSNNNVIRASVEALAPQRNPVAFQILLGHHPHAFDPAVDAGIPLTLSGHTHGGQLMLTERLGAGPVIFRYWSGLYRHGNSSLVVTNGAGNWFPLRINAPAEILHLTLRRET